MKRHSHESNTPDRLQGQRLDELYRQVKDVIVTRQNPISGLLPASTAITVHGNYTDAWVRDNVYSILAVWGLALAYQRRGDDPARTYQLEQSVVKLMRGLLAAMMKQAHKVQAFKHSQDPLDALHAKYDTRTGEPVVGDDGWGHLQLDATSLFLLMLAQMTASGLRIVFTLDEVDFVQNLVHYLSRAYHTPDYGIWERGHKKNEGQAELNGSSVGMAKAALEALQGFNLCGPDGGADAVIHVVPDDIAHARNTLEALLPRESNSKEVDAALLSVIGFPAFAVEDPGLVARTRATIISKLQGRYGCKRFLRDGHQTVVENHQRLHYEAGELRLFQHIESEWPLFFTYLLLDGVLLGDADQAADYRTRLERLCVVQAGQRLLPELYYVPAESVEWEKLKPQSQARLPNENVPLVWAQSLYLLGVLLQEGFIEPTDIDPLARRERIGSRRDNRIRVALVAANTRVQARLKTFGIAAETAAEISPLQLRPAADLSSALAELGRNDKLSLTGRAPRAPGSLMTSQVFALEGGGRVVFLPSVLNQRDFYLSLDNRLVTEQLKSELAYIQRHWDRPQPPLMALLVGESMLAADGRQKLFAFFEALRDGRCGDADVQLVRLSEAAETEPVHIHCLNRLEQPVFLPANNGAGKHTLNWSDEGVGPVAAVTAADWRNECNSARLQTILARCRNPFEQIELLGLLWEREGADHVVGPLNASVRQLTESLYRSAGQARLWGVVRRAAGLLELFDDTLEEAVAEIVVRQHQLALGRGYSSEAVIVRPLSNARIVKTIQTFGGDDPRGHVLIQELVLYLGTLIKADPSLFSGTLTLRPWHLLLLLTGVLAWEREVNQAEAFDALLDLGPHDLMDRLQGVIGNAEEIGQDLARLETLHPEEDVFGLKRVRFSPSDNPKRPEEGGWVVWRETSGVLTRLPHDFYTRVWEILRHCGGLVIGDQLDNRNRLDSEFLRADMTPTEKEFALRVEHLLNDIQHPEYRQLCIETLLALSEILRVNSRLELEDDLVLDVIIGNAVYLAWREAYPELEGSDYNEHCGEAWSDFYASAPHQVANGIMGSLLFLLAAVDEGVEAAA